MPIERPKPLGYCSVCLSPGPPDLSWTVVPKVCTHAKPKIYKNTEGEPKIMWQVTQWLCQSSGPSSLWSPRSWTIPISFEVSRSFAKKDVGCMASANQSKISKSLFLDLFRSQLNILVQCQMPPPQRIQIWGTDALPHPREGFALRCPNADIQLGHVSKQILKHAGKTCACIIWFSGVLLRPLQEWIEKSNAKALAHLFDKLVVGHHEEARGGGLFHKYITCPANQHQQYECCSASNPWIRPRSTDSRLLWFKGPKPEKENHKQRNQHCWKHESPTSRWLASTMYSKDSSPKGWAEFRLWVGQFRKYIAVTRYSKCAQTIFFDPEGRLQ